MTTPSCKPAPHLYRRCLLVAGLFFFLFLAITFGLWRASVMFLDYRYKENSKQSSRQALGRLMTFLENRLIVLRQVSLFYIHTENIQQHGFQGFCEDIMAVVPGILAILLTDHEGNPTWMASPDALPMSAVYIMTADPKLRSALSRARSTMQPAMTETMDVPDRGAGFMAITPIMVGNRYVGNIVGIFHYQSLLSNLLQPDLLSHYHLRIVHAGWPIFSTLTGLVDQPPAGRAPPDNPYGTTEKILFGGQEWVVSVGPIDARGASPANFVSLTILGLGLSLSLLLAWLVYRWQWRALRFQTEARDSQTRLERTGLNLLEIKSEMNLIMNSVDESIIFYDDQLDPVQANAAFMMAFRMNEDGKPMKSGHAHHEHMIQHIGSETKYWSLFNTLKNNPDQSYTDELEVQSKDAKGPVRMFLRRAATVRGADGSARGVIAVYKDVTKMKAMDRVKDEFLSNITHELRSPLASIKGFAETIRRDPQMAAETRGEFVWIICNEAARLQELIEELLDLRRMEAQGAPFNPTQYDLKALTEEVIRSVRSVLYAKNLSIKIQWGGLYGSPLQGDVGQISRALRNLLVNAAKYSPEKGEILLAGHCGQQRVWIEITDQGIGIDEKDLPHIFEKFYRGSRQGRQKGTGMGLAIVKHIIEQHGGHLGVRSEVGVGTTFRMELPRSFQPLTQGALEDSTPGATTGGEMMN